jgi:carboxyl-terminal processing protease
MKRSFVFGIVTVALLLNLAVGAKIFWQNSHAAKEDDNARENFAVFSEAIQKIRNEYVDGTNLTYQQLVYAALKGTVGKLDPHSEFLDEDLYQELQDDTEGQFGGLGLNVRLVKDRVTVISPMEDSPASRAGLLAGDRIVKVDGNGVEKKPMSDVVKLLRGAPDSFVDVTVERPPANALTNFHLQRAIIQMPMVKDLNEHRQFPLDENKIGYARITQFGEKTGEELQAALDKMKEQGMRGLVLDLRWNPGGLLEEAVEVCQKFLPHGQLVVTTEGRRGVMEKYFAKGDGDEFPQMPVVVLVNLSTASAAEIVSGCLQDLHRAYVIGEKTFGKGSVQTIFQLTDGSALKLTVAKYYTPSHKVIHQQGIMPDSVVPLTDIEEAALIVKRTPGGTDLLPDRERALVENTRDEQYDRAVDLLKSLAAYDQLNPAPKSAKMAAK